MFRLKEAIERAKQNGKPVQRKQIAAVLWPDSNEVTQQVNMTSLTNKTPKKISPEWVPVICKMLDCTADYLFGLEEIQETKGVNYYEMFPNLEKPLIEYCLKKFPMYGINEFEAIFKNKKYMDSIRESEDYLGF